MVDAPERVKHEAGSPIRDKGIVYALWKQGSARSSDLHEWCNDLSAVSTRDSAKLWCS